MAEIASATTDDHHRDHDDEEDGNNSGKKILKVDEDKGKQHPISYSYGLIKELCSHLPLFSVLNCLLVSKEWKQVISDYGFLLQHSLQFHSQHLDEPPGVLVCPMNRTPVYAILSPNQDPELVDINPSDLKVRLDQVLPVFKKYFPSSFVIGSCNGLLLYGDLGVEFLGRVYNPMINQHRGVPLIDSSQINFEYPCEIFLRESPYLLFDPSISLSFQVLVIVHERPSTEFQILVYSSQNDKWRYIATIPHDLQHKIHWESIMFNGVIYIVRDHDLICFDARDDSVWLLQLPAIPEDNHKRDVLNICECGGRLLLIEEYDLVKHWFPFHFKIMEMVEIPGQATTWIQRYQVNLEEGYHHFNPETVNPFGISVMHVYETDEGDEAVLLDINLKILASFNLTTNTFGAEPSIPYYENYAGSTVFPPTKFSREMYPFSPTLFPLDPLPEHRFGAEPSNTMDLDDRISAILRL